MRKPLKLWIAALAFGSLVTFAAHGDREPCHLDIENFEVCPCSAATSDHEESDKVALKIYFRARMPGKFFETAIDAVDPRNWDDCKGLGFHHTYLVAKDTPHEAICDEPHPPEDPVDGRDYEGTLFEHYEVMNSFVKVDVRNLLCVHSKKNEASYVATYGLKVNGCTKIEGYNGAQLVEDCGTTEVKLDDGYILIEGNKVVRFQMDDPGEESELMARVRVAYASWARGQLEKGIACKANCELDGGFAPKTIKTCQSVCDFSCDRGCSK